MKKPSLTASCHESRDLPTPVIKPIRKVRVLVVDDQPLMRESIARHLEIQGDLIVCAQADSIVSARTEAARHKPELVLMELCLGTGDTLELIKALKCQVPPIHILVFSHLDETAFAERALRAGAGGYVMKQETAGDLLAAIRIVLRGEMYVSRRIAVQILKKSFTGSVIATRGEDAAVDKLSDRELHVFQMLGAGFSSRQIAGDLNLSVKTIEAHRENIKHKLGMENGACLRRVASEWAEQHFQLCSRPGVRGG